MITNAPRYPFAADSTVTPVEDQGQGFLAWILGKLQRLVCALHGHDVLMHYERNRVYLRCTSCGYETPGWEVAGNARLAHRAAEARPVLGGHGDLAVARKIA